MKIRSVPAVPFTDNTTEARCDATIAICTYNRIGTLPRTLQSLSRLRGAHSFEVIVVNGPSTDGTSEFLASQIGIRLFENSEANLSISRNIAIANAVGRFIAFIDDDAIPEPDWLSLLLDRFQKDKELSALGGFIRDASGMGFQTRYVFCDALGKAVACDNPDYISFDTDGRRHFPSLTGTNVIFGLARKMWRAPTEEPGGVSWETGTDRHRSFGVKRCGWR